MAKNPQLIATDEDFFRELRRLYWGEMSGFLRRYLSLKTLTGLRLLAYSPSTRLTVVPLDVFVLQEIYYAYRHPDSVTSATDWIQWVFRLRKRNKRHALEFVEGWNSTRVIIAAALPWLISCLVGIIWTATRGDAQTAFTVASFILTSGTGEYCPVLIRLKFHLTICGHACPARNDQWHQFVRKEPGGPRMSDGLCGRIWILVSSDFAFVTGLGRVELSRIVEGEVGLWCFAYNGQQQMMAALAIQAWPRDLLLCTGRCRPRSRTNSGGRGVHVSGETRERRMEEGGRCNRQGRT
ncbi:hypothetical protein BU23DRAFT_156017 [Bimuria novae-zelandiae CBS 107.79]|uniref:Uncharacterized protein n=1 Tax=Bimuria novae-zelandiae CBS 107.79 TaxID=1447943 RepID=A0A6A5VHB1_9PLEO|nr:hypothetical protein BU23DRAFT_156017 [Bimuria novae-zelandiae CBS 107.79]